MASHNLDQIKYDISLTIIGGTGLYHISDSPALNSVLSLVEVIPIVETPFGETSSPIYIYKTTKTSNPVYIAFLARHGLDHQYSPTSVPYQANISAIKRMKCNNIIAFSSVGSLKSDCKPTDFILPDQIIDLTKGLRPHSFLNELGLVGHISFGDPFSHPLREYLHSHNSSDPVIESLHVGGILFCMEGPQFSTRAESLMYIKMGGEDAKCINMSCVPESKLAKELEINYQMVCMVTDYDSWRLTDKPVDIQEVVKNLKQNSIKAKQMIFNIVQNIETLSASVGTPLKNNTFNSISIKNIDSVKTNNKYLNDEQKLKLDFIFPEW
ncbi:hypothetical protein QEN19_001900 [Hanseniaspora menglaensis]